MGWAGVSEGLKHWDTKAIGGAINQVYANHVEETAKEAAKKKYDDQVAALQKEYAAGQEAQKAGNSTPQPRALPTQADGPATANTGVDAVSAPQQAAIKPMTKAQYEAKLREAENSYKNDESQARIDYYKARGMDEERFKAEDELKNSKFHQGMVKKYYDVVNGDPTATKELVNYMNASMGGGNQIAMNDDGTMSLLQNGKVVQANFTPSRQQINDAFGSMYTMAKFVNDGNFDSMLDRSSKMQGMDLAERGDARADRRLDLDTLIADRNFQAKMEELGLTRDQMRQTLAIFQEEQDRLDARQGREIEAADRRQAIGIAATATENEKDRSWRSGEAATDRTFKAGEAEKDRSWRSGESLKDRTWRTGEAATERAWKSGENEKDRASREAIADRGYAIDARRVTLEEKKYQDEREAAARDMAEKTKGVWKQDTQTGEYVLLGKDGRLYARQSPDGPVIPAGMDDTQYESFMKEAADRKLTPTLYAPEGEPLMLVVELPDGTISDDLEEAEAIWKEYERSQSAIPPQGGRR